MDYNPPGPRPFAFFSRGQVGAFLLVALLLGTLVGVFLILRPYLHAIILGVLFASVFQPLHRFIRARTGPRPNLAAGLTCGAVASAVVIPLTLLTWLLVAQAYASFTDIQAWVKAGNLVRELQECGLGPEPPAPTADAPCPAWKLGLARQVHAWRQRLAPDLDPATIQEAVLGRSGDWAKRLAPEVWSLVLHGFDVLLNFLLLLVVMFYCFRDGPALLRYVLSLSPLMPEHEALLLARIRAVARAAIMGSGLTALAQAVLAMIAFAVVGIPWLVWGVVLGFASLVPLVGTAIVWVPCCGYLLAQGRVGAALGLAIWCALVVGLVDNIIRPLMMKGGTGMSSVLAFFAIIGGIQCFGLVGVLYGPLLFGLAAVLLYIYRSESGRAPAAGPGQFPPSHRRPRHRPRHRGRANDYGPDRGPERPPPAG